MDNYNELAKPSPEKKSPSPALPCFPNAEDGAELNLTAY